MKLHPVKFAFFVSNNGKGSPFGDGDNLKTGRESCDLIAVAHPDLMPLALFPEAIKQSTAFSNFDESAPEFSRLAAFHLTAELRHHHLLAITDAQNWNTGLKEMLRSAGGSEEHTSELQSLMRTSYAVLCLKKKQKESI